MLAIPQAYFCTSTYLFSTIDIDIGISIALTAAQTPKSLLYALDCNGRVQMARHGLQIQARDAGYSAVARARIHARRTQMVEGEESYSRGAAAGIDVDGAQSCGQREGEGEEGA